jgi:hypothetical protein
MDARHFRCYPHIIVDKTTATTKNFFQGDEWHTKRWWRFTSLRGATTQNTEILDLTFPTVTNKKVIDSWANEME